MNEQRVPAIGDPVIFVDTHGQEHNALVTRVFGDTPSACINLVYVSSVPGKDDQYGRQIERVTSIVPRASQTAHGFFFYFPE